MCAGLEVDVQRAVHRALAGRRQSLLLGVWFTRLAVVPLAGQEAGSVEHDGAHHGVRAGPVVRRRASSRARAAHMQVYGSVVISGIQFWQIYPRRTNHPVIDNRKVYEILHCFQALDPLTLRLTSMS